MILNLAHNYNSLSWFSSFQKSKLQDTEETETALTKKIDVLVEDKAEMSEAIDSLKRYVCKFINYYYY